MRGRAWVGLVVALLTTLLLAGCGAPGAILPVAIDPLDPTKVALAIYRDK